jgi:hypothetical protein
MKIIRRNLLGLLLAASTPYCLAATFTVTNTNDNGTGSLRWAIEQANAAAGADLIHFNIGGTGVRTISPTSPLPALSSTITIDGTTQPGYASSPLIQINGTNAGAGSFGLVVSAANVQIHALTINRFSGGGIRIDSGNNAVISASWIGLAQGGATAQANGAGIRIDGGSGHVIGPSNAISGNTNHGIRINVGASSVTVRGNRIGTNPGGSAAIGNGFSGISVAGASGVLIGGTSAADQNTISGNTNHGVVLNGGSGNRLERNFIGTNAAGSAALPNAEQGVHVLGGSDHAIGGSVAGTFNVISGNTGDGIRIEGGALRTLVQRNVIGTTVAGSAALGNGLTGVRNEAATFTRIGTGTSVADGGNLIAGNLGYGIDLLAGSDDAIVQANRIGTDVNGGVAIPNSSGDWGTGVQVQLSHRVRIGVAGAGNLISGHGVGLSAWGTTGLRVEANRVGTNIDGSAAIRNSTFGINVSGSEGAACSDVVIGGSFGSTGNLVAGNGFDSATTLSGAGINIFNCSGVSIRGNRIGTDAEGATAIRNNRGVVISDSNFTLGGADHTSWTCDGDCNLISGNGPAGVQIDASTGSLLGNFIGVRLDGSAALPNVDGIRERRSTLTIGGSSAGAGNLISGNTLNGISSSNFTSGNSTITVLGNRIGSNRTGTGKIPNSEHGINASASGSSSALMLVGSSDHDAGVCNRACNLIVGNGNHGIYISQDVRRAHRVQGNFIGRNISGACLGNTGDGIHIRGSASSASIGGANAAEGNSIGCNRNGIVLQGSDNDTTLIRNNSIHAHSELGIDLRDNSGGSVGVTPNDPGDGDNGANGLQNFPQILSATTNGSTLTVQIELSSRSGRTYTVEFFRSPQCHAGGFGEGLTPIGTVAMTTDNSGFASLQHTFSVPVTVGEGIAATASGNSWTSEFSACVQATPPPQPGAIRFALASASVAEGLGGSLEIEVTRSGTAGGVTVNYASINGTATAPADFAAASGTLSFAAGETSKRFTVEIVNDGLHEIDETFSLALSNPTGGATLTSPSSMVITIVDDDPAPSLSVDNGGCTVTEGNSGSVNCPFVFRLSAVSGRSTTFNTATANGTAIAGQDYTGHTSTARSIAAGQTTLTVNVPVLGDTLHEATETFTLNATSVVGASPSSLSATGTILDNDPAPTLSVDNGGCTVSEGDTGSVNCPFVFRLSAVSGRNTTFNTATANGTAIAGQDYTGHTSTARSIAAGQTTLTVNVPVLGDTLHEATETFTLNASSVVGASPSSLSATGTILDNDQAPTLSIDNGGCSVTEGDSGSTPCNFVLRLSAVSGRSTTFNTATADGSATAGSDYTGHPSTARSIAAGQTTLTVTVPVLGDTEIEPDETFSLLVTNVVGASPGSLSATGTILNDEVDQPGAGVLSLSPQHQSVPENAGTASFSVLRSGGSSGAISVDYATVDGSAIAPQDYLAASGTLHFADGQTSRSIEIALIDDALHESTENLTVVLSNPSGGASLGSPASATLNLIDNDPAPILSIDDGGCSVIEGDSGSRPCRFQLRLSAVSGRATDFVTATLDDDAEHGLDYLGHDATARSIPAGQSSLGIDVPVLGDTLPEVDERFFLLVEQVDGATPAQLQGIGTILDDDLPPDADLIFRSNFEAVEAL